MSIANNLELKVSPQKLCRRMNIRRADERDVEEIFNVACTVGTSEKNPEQGFLVDDYLSDPNYYKMFIRNRINELQHIYVAEYDQIYGFMITYTKEQWLKYNPTWIEDIHWKPDFDRKRLDNFVMVDKTAIVSHMTGMGIGSMLYNYMIDNLRADGISNIFAETIISPAPNFASLQFRIKQKYTLAGMRYEEYKQSIYTDLIYYKYAE